MRGSWKLFCGWAGIPPFFHWVIPLVPLEVGGGSVAHGAPRLARCFVLCHVFRCPAAQWPVAFWLGRTHTAYLEKMVLSGSRRSGEAMLTNGRTQRRNVGGLIGLCCYLGSATNDLSGCPAIKGTTKALEKCPVHTTLSDRTPVPSSAPCPSPMDVRCVCKHRFSTESPWIARTHNRIVGVCWSGCCPLKGPGTHVSGGMDLFAICVGNY